MWGTGGDSPRLISSLPSSMRSEVNSLSPMNCWKPIRLRQRVPRLRDSSAAVCELFENTKKGQPSVFQYNAAGPHLK